MRIKSSNLDLLTAANNSKRGSWQKPSEHEWNIGILTRDHVITRATQNKHWGSWFLFQNEWLDIQLYHSYLLAFKNMFWSISPNLTVRSAVHFWTLHCWRRLRRQQRAAGGVTGGGACNGGLLRREQRLRLGDEGPDAGRASHRDGTGQLCGKRPLEGVGVRAWGSVMDPNGVYSHIDIYCNTTICIYTYIYIYTYMIIHVYTCNLSLSLSL